VSRNTGRRIRASPSPQKRNGRIQTLSILPRDFDIRGPYGGPTRLALAPDGKSVITTIRKNQGDIWILDGFNPPRSFWERLWPWKR